MSILDAAGSQLRRWRAEPHIFVREVFGAEPDPWQDDVLRLFPTSPRLAMKASKGPGKSCCLAWLSWNFLLTRPFPKVAACSITGDNLADGLWTEMAKWKAKSPILDQHFTWQKTRIFANDHPENWWMSARTWSKSADPQQQADTLAGLHEDFILMLLDEAGSIPDAVMASAEPALASCVEGHIVIAGNPTRLDGPLHRACVLERKSWVVVEISGDPDDPKRSSRVSVQWARDQIARYGREHPWVLVNVFGRFPPSSFDVLIGPDEMRDAMKRGWRDYDIGGASKVLGVDVARFGDDESVIFPRHGIQAHEPKAYRNLDSLQGAGQVNRKWDDWGADACFLDMTGGFGAGWFDQLKALGKAPIGINFSQQPHDVSRYYNKRAEMAFDAVAWIKNGGALPDCPELLRAATQITYTFKGDKLILEDKEQLKERLGYSPDHFDAFILTFAEPVQAAQQRRSGGRTVSAASADYDPFREVNSPLSSAVDDSYKPFR